MRIILGATIGLLALGSVGLAVFAYTEHREVAYLTLRADHLESRITELESATSAPVSSWARPTPEERNELRRRLDLPPREWETPTPTAVAEPLLRGNDLRHALGLEPLPNPSGSGSVVYTDEQLYETPGEGPNRINCPDPNERTGPNGNYRPWWYASLVEAMREAGHCVTVEERLDRLERER